MRLDAVYELRDRLETAAIAGVNLIPEDFRLRRSVQQLEPYAKASPVFQKIYAMALKLTAAECADRAGVLFDTLGLVDAVLCTQGTLQTEGSLQPLVTEERSQLSVAESGMRPLSAHKNQGELYRQVPYSRMAPVLGAFRGTGGGRYAVIRDAYETDPEVFQDYRMKYWMVQALGDSYADLADMVAEWLKEEGTPIVPLLKKDFRPDGKKDMVRRLRVIEAVAKEAENDFYRSVLAEAGKEVREETIRALRFEKSNLPLLLELAKTEKGKCRDAVLYSMSCMDGADAEAFWKVMMEKNPEEAADYLEWSDAGWAGDLIADALERWFAQYGPGTKAREAQGKMGELDKDKAASRHQEAQMLLQKIWQAAAGKYSERLLEWYDKVYLILHKEAVSVLAESLIRNSHPELCRLAGDLYQKHGDEYLEPVFTASLLTESAGRTLERFGDYLKPSGVFSKLAGKKKNPDGILRVFAKLSYNEQQECYTIVTNGIDLFVQSAGSHQRRLPSGIDPGWYPLLMNYEGRSSKEWKRRWGEYSSYYDGILARLYCPGIASLAQQYGAYFYGETMKRPATVGDVRMLKKCGWTNYKGILASCTQGGTMQVFMIRQLLPELPLTSDELADELDELLRRMKGKAVNGIGVLEQWRDSLRGGLTADRL